MYSLAVRMLVFIIAKNTQSPRDCITRVTTGACSSGRVKLLAQGVYWITKIISREVAGNTFQTSLILIKFLTVWITEENDAITAIQLVSRVAG